MNVDIMAPLASSKVIPVTATTKSIFIIPIHNHVPTDIALQFLDHT
ncbi:MAG: hypothetical protein FWE38_01725 [Firmicutes bacterium]|nr:hypothetical protein [Bacillota bacterium]